MANGLAGDVVTAACLATSAPVVVAPAMDGDMWTHPRRAPTSRGCATVRLPVVEPEAGPLASGQAGRAASPSCRAIVDAVVAAVGRSAGPRSRRGARPPLVDARPREADLEGRHVVITAGGTREPIDPVRFIGNRSTGKMGVALAEAALARGARVTLVAAGRGGPAGRDAARSSAVETTRRAAAALVRRGDRRAAADALVMAAAVADFRPADAADEARARRAG